MWSLNTRKECKMPAAELRVQREMKGVTRRDKVRNLDSRRELRAEPLLQSPEKVTAPRL